MSTAPKMFHELGSAQLIEHAKEVIAGMREICVLVDRQCYALNRDALGYEPRTPGWMMDEESPCRQQNALLDQFEVDRVLDEKVGDLWTTLEFDHLKCREQKLLSFEKFHRWAKKNNLIVEPGFYTIADSRELALVMVGGESLPRDPDGKSIVLGVIHDARRLELLNASVIRTAAGHTFVSVPDFSVARYEYGFTAPVVAVPDAKTGSFVTDIVRAYLLKTDLEGGWSGLKKYLVKHHNGVKVPQVDFIRIDDELGQPKKIAFGTWKNRLTKEKKNLRREREK